jgi:hypothetical protein
MREVFFDFFAAIAVAFLGFGVMFQLLTEFATAYPVDVALNRPIWANVTCGSTSNGGEQYLSSRFVYSSSAVRAANLETCRSGQRPPSAMVDGVTDTWWQSTSRTNALGVFGATTKRDAEIFIDLQQVR